MNVSAIIPAYNRRNYIERAIDSVLAQTVPVDEIIVVDDGSTDGTGDLVAHCYRDKVRLIRQKNAGVSGARRTGIAAARGEWIAFLDSDDEWMPGRNAQLLAASEQVPADVAWIFGDMQVVTDHGDSTTLYGEHGLSLKSSPEVFEDSLAVQFPFQFGLLQGSFIRRSVLTELDCFSAGLRSDDDLWAGFQIACRYKFAAISDVVGKYFRTSDLAAGSVVVNGVHGPDHYRSRMLSFGLVVQSGHKRPWNLRYAAEAQCLCKLLATKGPVPRKLVLEQFRYGGISLKGIAFAVVGLMGRRAILAWNAAAESRRNRIAGREMSRPALPACATTAVQK
jgi:glycosyltransferase involved in cell wall biosynthesis